MKKGLDLSHNYIYQLVIYNFLDGTDKRTQFVLVQNKLLQKSVECRICTSDWLINSDKFIKLPLWRKVEKITCQNPPLDEFWKLLTKNSRPPFCRFDFFLVLMAKQASLSPKHAENYANPKFFTTLRLHNFIFIYVACDIDMALDWKS